MAKYLKYKKRMERKRCENLLEKLKGERTPEESLAAHPNALFCWTCSVVASMNLFFISWFKMKSRSENMLSEKLKKKKRSDCYLFCMCV